VPPKLGLTKSTVQGTPGFKFTIKVEEGSYPIGSWTLSFGDGTSETGQGKASTSFTHAYASPGAYKVEFSVTDSAGTITKKSLNLTIVAKKPS
jgi:PKD repeat protein